VVGDCHIQTHAALGGGDSQGFSGVLLLKLVLYIFIEKTDCSSNTLERVGGEFRETISKLISRESLESLSLYILLLLPP